MNGPQTRAPDGAKPVMLGPGEGDARWWGDSLSVIKASGAATGGSLSVIENFACAGAAAPLHVHYNEGEGFYVVEGALTIWVGGRVLEAAAGSFVYGPPGVPHTFEVTSPTARYLFITSPAGFADFVRDVSDAAERMTLPPTSAESMQLSADRIEAATRRYNFEILGPPGIPPASPMPD